MWHGPHWTWAPSAVSFRRCRPQAPWGCQRHHPHLECRKGGGGSGGERYQRPGAREGKPLTRLMLLKSGLDFALSLFQSLQWLVPIGTKLRTNSLARHQNYNMALTHISSFVFCCSITRASTPTSQASFLSSEYSLHVAAMRLCCCSSPALCVFVSPLPIPAIRASWSPMFCLVLFQISPLSPLPTSTREHGTQWLLIEQVTRFSLHWECGGS